VNDLHQHELHACHECDLLLIDHGVEKGRKAVCPRCGAVLFENKPDTINRTLALTIAGLLLFLPANLLPILSLNIMGNESYNTIVGAVSALAVSGHFLVALLVLFCSVVAPFISLCLLLLILVQTKLRRDFMPLPQLFHFYNHLDSWAMLEIYMIALLIAIIKLLDMAEVSVNLGMICFIGLLMTYLGTKVTLEKSVVWKVIETRNQK
jgi:paraquat-inducible protein A